MVNLQRTAEGRRYVQLMRCNANGWCEKIAGHASPCERVMMERPKAAKLIADAITKAVLDAMEAKDTQMGYPKRAAHNT